MDNSISAMPYWASKLLPSEFYLIPTILIRSQAFRGFTKALFLRCGHIVYAPAAW